MKKLKTWHYAVIFGVIGVGILLYLRHTGVLKKWFDSGFKNVFVPKGIYDVQTGKKIFFKK